MSRRILYVQYTNPAGYPPLEHSSRILADRGWNVLFLGTGADGAADKFEFPSHPRVRVRRLRFIQPGWRQKVHFMWFHLWVLFWLLVWRPRWIYASDLMACSIGWLCTFLPGIRVFYHEHDSPQFVVHGPHSPQLLNSSTPQLDQSVVRGPWSVVRPPSPVVRGLLWFRRRLACRAELCVLPNQRRIEVFRQSTGRTAPIECVWNCPSLRDAQLARESEQHCGLVVFYHGSIVPVRVPVALVRALALLPEEVRLKIAGYETRGSKGYVTQLQEEAKCLNVEHRFEYLGAMSRFELLPLCRQADVGLAFMPLGGDDLNEQAMVGASNKPFEYLANGLALLVSDLLEWRMMFVKPGYGLACNPEDPDSVAAALRWFFEHPEQTWQMGEGGRQRTLQDWNYESQFASVAALLSADKPL